MVIITAEMIINDPARRDEIVAAMAEANKINHGAEGCIIHDWYANLWEPNRIRLYIEYENYELELATEKKLGEVGKKLFELQQSGALTIEYENNLRRYELGAELPPMYGMG